MAETARRGASNSLHTFPSDLVGTSMVAIPYSSKGGPPFGPQPQVPCPGGQAQLVDVGHPKVTHGTSTLYYHYQVWPLAWSVARGLSRVLFSAAVGAKTPEARQHRSTIALAGFPSQKKVSVETSGSWRPEHQFQFLLIIHSKCDSVTNQPKLLSGSSHLSFFSCARLLRMFERSGCGRGNTNSSMLDILIKLLTLFS